MVLPDHIAYTHARMQDVDLHLAGSILSAREQAYLETIPHEGRQTEYTAGRIVARQLAADILQLSPQDVPIDVADDGSLVLTGRNYGLSLAHAHGGVCAVVARDTSVGIDLERIKPRHPELYRFILHPDEYHLLESLDLERDQILILCWALKEATLKGMKTGFRCSPKKLKIAVDLPNQQARITADGGSAWQLGFEEIDGCYLAIAYPA
ncbi:MAG: 4'-phosphopantetheinyl transferase superfamily protein [Bacteroidota bacterium]